MNIEFEKTRRNLDIGRFDDFVGNQCSIQQASQVETAILLGVDVTRANTIVNARMHLTREQAADLITVLQRFVETGSIV